MGTYTYPYLFVEALEKPLLYRSLQVQTHSKSETCAVNPFSYVYQRMLLSLHRNSSIEFRNYMHRFRQQEKGLRQDLDDMQGVPSPTAKIERLLLDRHEAQ